MSSWLNNSQANQFQQAQQQQHGQAGLLGSQQNQANNYNQSIAAGQLQGSVGIWGVESWSKYNKDNFSISIGEECTFIYNGNRFYGKIVKVDGSYIEVKEGRNLFLVGLTEVIEIPVIDKMKASLLYRLVVSPQLFEGQSYLGTRGQLTSGIIQNAINIVVNKGGQP